MLMKILQYNRPILHEEAPNHVLQIYINTSTSRLPSASAERPLGRCIRQPICLSQVGGKDFGPYPLTNGQYSGPVTAPTVPTTITGAPYPVTVTYLPDPASTGLYTNPSPPYTIPLNVSPATTTITEAVTPASAGAGSPVTATGTVAGSNGATPVGTVTTTVRAPQPTLLHQQPSWPPLVL